MPSGHSGLDELNQADEASGIQLSTNKFGAIFKIKPGVGTNGECVDTPTAPDKDTQLPATAKKAKRKEGNGRTSIPKKKKNSVGATGAKIRKLAPKLVAGDQHSVDKEKAPCEEKAQNSLKQETISSTAAEPVTVRPEIEQPVTRVPRVVVASAGELGLDLLSRQISNRVLPPFSPTYGPPDRFEISLPDDGYRCRDCHDRFLLPDSLEEHLRRRSVFISFDCLACRRLLTFYNRCSLLEHVRGHREPGETVAVDARLAKVSPLPHELVPAVQECSSRTWEKAVMGFLRGGCGGSAPAVGELPAVIPVVKDRNDPIVKVAMPATSATPILPLPDVSGSRNNDSDDQSLSYRCSECPAKFADGVGFRKHFIGGNGDSGPLTPTDASLQCRACSMICTTTCSLSAHRRTHQQRRPYVCPECGQQIANTWTAFQRHVTFTCYHPSRTVGFECPSCSALSPTPDRLRRHLDTRHDAESFVKCMACPMAFKNQEAFRGHRQEAHTEEPEVRCGVIFKCPLCEVVFQKEPALRDHLDAHFRQLLPLRMAKYLFRCPKCSELFRSKHLVARHVGDVHPELLIVCAKTRAKKVTNGPKRGIKSSPDTTSSSMEQPDASTPAAASTTSPKKAGVGRRGRKKVVASLSPTEPVENGTTLKDDSWLDEDADDPARENGKVVAKVIRRRRRPNVNPRKFECDKCGCSFRTRHWSRVHEKRCRGSLTRQTTCAVCHEDFGDQHDMARHGHEHLKDGTLVCTLCHCLPFTTKLSLARHIENHALHYTYPYTCSYCQLELADIKAANQHWRDEHGLLSFHCQLCDVEYLYQKSLSRHVKDVHGNAKSSEHYSCAFCLEEGFETVEEANSHIERMHDVAADKIDGHMVKRKFRNPDFARRKPGPHGRKRVVADNENVTSEPPQTQPLPPIPKLTIKIEPADEDADEDQRRSDGSSATSSKPKRPRLSIKKEEYRCAKCDYHVDSDRSLFLEHLRLQHPPDGDDDDDDVIQCLECGISFAVEASLRRHLIFSHRVKDVERFLRDKGYHLRPAETEVPDEELDSSGDVDSRGGGVMVGAGEPVETITSEPDPVDPLECRVCYVRFDSDLALKVHSRTHGMAFIRSKFANAVKGGAAGSVSHAASAEESKES